MSSQDFYKQGDNRLVASGVLGAFWNFVFPNNGIVDTVETTAGRTLNITESLMRVMPSWITGSKDGALRIDRLEVVPVDKVVPTEITNTDGYQMNSGAYMGAMSPSLRWQIPLSISYKEIPIIVPLGSEPLLCGVDYSFKNDKILLRTNPSALGLESTMQDVDGLPAASWRFLLAGAVPQNETTQSNFDFYGIPEDARRALLDMLTQEGSLSRILRFLESCVGIQAPTKFELSDNQGYYTTLESSWVEEGIWYGVTTAGELISAPEGWGLENGFSATGNIIRPDVPLVHGISVSQKLSDSDSYGIGSTNAFIPNSDISAIDGNTISFGNMSPFGVFNPDGVFNTRVEDTINAQGRQVSELFPTAITGNCVKFFYDHSGRQEPAVISVSDKLSAVLANTPRALDAVRDSVPAGSLYVINTNLEQSDEVSISVTDACESFLATTVEDSVTLTVSAYAATARKSAL